MFNFKSLFLRKRKKEIINFPDGLKWIYVSLVVYFGGTKKEIIKIANDIANIINNTHSAINKNGQIAGYINPYLGIDFVSVSKSEKNIIKNIPNLYCGNLNNGGLLNMTRKFFPLIKKVDKRWRLTFVPEKIDKRHKTHLYSIENLNNDIWMLAGSSNLICEKYSIPINEEKPTYNPIILEGAPAIELHDHLLIIKYHVCDRINFARKNQVLDKIILGNGETIFEVIKKICKYEPNSEWSKKAKMLLDE